MTYSEALTATKSFASRGLLWPALLFASIVAAYFPTVITLAQGPWQTEQEGHGPLIIAAAAWLVWQCRDRLRTATRLPSPGLGWLVRPLRLVLVVLSRHK